MATSPFIFNVTAADFTAHVVEASHRVPVLVDFWASWCSPCQMLMPVLAQLVDELDGRVLLAKVDSDAEQALAIEYGVRSLPTVMLFRNGEPVDQFLGALPEGEVRRFLEPHLPPPANPQLDRLEEQLAANELDAAAALLAELKAARPDDPRLALIEARIALAQGDAAAARACLDALPLDQRHAPEIEALGARIEFASLLAEAPPAAELDARLTDNPRDSEAAYLRAIRQAAAGDYPAALDGLLALLRRDPDFRDEAPRKTMLTIFELAGDEGLTARYRGRMFAALH